MKNMKLSILVLLLAQTVTFAQVKLSKDFTVTVGTPYQVVDAGNKEYFSDGKGHTISVKTKGKEVTIQRYDIGDMKELSNKMYEDFPPANKVQKILKVGDKLFYVFSSFDKKAKKENLYSREVNMNDGTFEEPKLLFSTAKEVTVSAYGDPAGMSMFGMGIPIRFEVHKSFDNSKILIRYRLKPEEKNDAKNYDVLGFYVFNTKLEKQWGGEVKMPYTEKVMNNLAYGVNKEGKAYMLAYINASKQFELINIGSDLKTKTNKIDIDGKLVFQQLNLVETEDGNMTCIGFYASGMDVMYNWNGGGVTSFNTNGILDFKMDQNGKVLQKYDFEFPIELINQYESKRSKEKNEKREATGKAGINDLKLIDVSVDANGNTTIVGEQQYTRKEMVITEMKNVYYYGDIVATKFDKSGKLLWMKKLPKTQSAVGGDASSGMMIGAGTATPPMEKRGMSVRYMKGKDASYILFLDNVKNADLGINDVPERHKDGHGGFLTAYKIDDVTGAIEKHSIFDITDIQGIEAFQFKTSRIFEAADKVFMLEIYAKGKKDSMIKMELKK
ncbi:MAG TPA: hypothetical protein VGC65_11955 [Bacteroidia bacterium]